MNTDEAHRRAEALFKKEQQSLQAMREKTARLRALRLARDAVNQKMLLMLNVSVRPPPAAVAAVSALAATAGKTSSDEILVEQIAAGSKPA